MEAKIIPGFSAFRVTKCGKVLNKHNRILKDYDCNGYRRISLKRDDGKRVGVDVHRLVASTWIGEIPKGMWVNHENGDKSDNRVENLRIDTPGYNHKHAFEILGREFGNINPDRVTIISVLTKIGWSQHRIAKALGCSQPNVAQILKR